MGLGALVRGAVALANTVTADLQVSVTVYAWIGDSVANKPTYAAGVAYPALVEFEQRAVRMTNGQEVQQVAKVSFLRPITANSAAGRRNPIDPRDKIVLPSGFAGKVLSVSGLVDKATKAPFYAIVGLG